MNQEHENGMVEDNGEDGSAENGSVGVVQDTYRNVVFGQIADGLLPPHRGPQESSDDELTRAAMSDPAALEPEGEGDGQPTAWRWVFLLIIIVVSLAIVFWNKR